MISRNWRIAVAGSAVLIPLLVALWYMWPSDVGVFGTTTGEIIVSSPEIYSRERLVNDRFQEATWLQGELLKTNDLPWGVEASFQSSTSERINYIASGHLASTADHGTSSDATPSATLQPGSSPDHSKSSEATAPPSNAQQQGSAPAPAPIDMFHDKLAYRDEVRSASLETQLDDRHDIAGNTLYRVKFSVTVVPENDTSAWAVVYVEIKEGNEQAPGNSVYRELYHEWLIHYEDQLNTELDRLTDPRTDWHPDERRGISAYLVAALSEQECPNATADPDCRSRLAESMATRQRLVEGVARKQFEVQQKQCEAFAVSHPDTRCSTVAELDAKCDSSFSGPMDCPWYADDHGRPEALLHMYRDALYASRPAAAPGMRQFLREVVARYLLKGLDQWTTDEIKSGKLRHELWTARVTDCDMGQCHIELGARDDDAVDDFARALSADQVFAYAVSPKESVQRIGNLASSQRERQLALHAAEQLPGGSLDSLLQRSQREDSLVQAVLRKPLVVGFAELGGAKDKSVRDVAAFGWIIGPRFEIEGDALRFRHATAESEVSAIISVPSWWKWAQANVTTCWMDEREVRTKHHVRDGLDLYADCKHKHETDLPPIRLPNHPNEIARKLGLDVVRRPSVIGKINVTAREGARADILIMGNHLWRSTVVTLGGQPADNIMVLPDMKGIVARFDPVLPRAKNLIEGNQPLWVFTSEGEVLAGAVIIEKPDTARTSTANAAAVPASARIAMQPQNAKEVTQ